jgi:hypothetical protein
MLKAMLVASEVFPIDGPPGEDQQVRPVQAPELAVEVGEARGKPREAPVPLVGRVRHLHRIGHRLQERLEAAVLLALLGQRRAAARPRRSAPSARPRRRHAPPGPRCRGRAGSVRAAPRGRGRSAHSPGPRRTTSPPPRAARDMPARPAPSAPRRPRGRASASPARRARSWRSAPPPSPRSARGPARRSARPSRCRPRGRRARCWSGSRREAAARPRCCGAGSRRLIVLRRPLDRPYGAHFCLSPWSTGLTARRAAEWQIVCFCGYGVSIRFHRHPAARGAIRSTSGGYRRIQGTVFRRPAPGARRSSVVTAPTAPNPDQPPARSACQAAGARRNRSTSSSVPASKTPRSRAASSTSHQVHR